MQPWTLTLIAAVVVLVATVWMWRYASRIEREEAEEVRFREYIAFMDTVDPVQA